MPHYLKQSKLIIYINHAEIVKNFTNFACGFGGGAIKFWRSSNRAFPLHVRASVWWSSPFFAQRKQLTVSDS